MRIHAGVLILAPPLDGSGHVAQDLIWHTRVHWPGGGLEGATAEQITWLVIWSSIKYLQYLASVTSKASSCRWFTPFCSLLVAQSAISKAICVCCHQDPGCRGPPSSLRMKHVKFVLMTSLTCFIRRELSRSMTQKQSCPEQLIQKYKPRLYSDSKKCPMDAKADKAGNTSCPRSAYTPYKSAGTGTCMEEHFALHISCVWKQSPGTNGSL